MTDTFRGLFRSGAIGAALLLLAGWPVGAGEEAPPSAPARVEAAATAKAAVENPPASPVNDTPAARGTAVSRVEAKAEFAKEGPLRVRWALDLQDRKAVRFWLPPLGMDFNYLLIETDKHDLIAIHRRSGKALWWTRLQDAVNGSPYFTAHSVFFIAASHLICLERYSGEVVWRLPLDFPVAAGPVAYEPIARRPFLYVPGLDRRLYAMEATKVIWPPEVGAGSITREDFVMERFQLRVLWRSAIFGLITGDLAYDDQKVFAGDDKGQFYCISTTDVMGGQAEKDWVFYARGAISGGPLLHGPYAYISSRDTYIYAISIRDGGEVWKYPTGFTLETPPTAVVDPHTNKTYILQSCGAEGPLVALTDLEGKIAWEKPKAEKPVAQMSDPENELAKRALLVVRNKDNTLAAMHLSTGEEIWRIPAQAFGPFCINTQDELVYTAIDEGGVLCALEQSE